MRTIHKLFTMVVLLSLLLAGIPIRSAGAATTTITTVDIAGDVGYDTSLALNNNGSLFVSYYDYTNRELKLARVEPGPVLYATPGGLTGGFCDSWSNACDLQFALALSKPGQELWVKKGTHKPAAGTDRSATFQLKTGVGIYGGFAGTETARDQRNWTANITVLSGDIDDNDTTDANGVVTTAAGIVGDNSYHVVIGTGVDGSAVLNGFFITAGNAINGDGGGMYNMSGSPTLMNVSFSGNSAPTEENNFGHGGAIFNQSSSITLTDVTFNGNSAIYGGAIYNGSCSPTMTNVTFSGNSAVQGGGVYNYINNSILTNVTFNGNSASSVGGGIMNNVSNPILTDVTFSDNSAIEWGGGIFNYDSSPLIQNAIAWNNSSGLGGASVYNYSGTPNIRFSLVDGCNPGGVWNTACGTDGGNNLADTDPFFVDAVSGNVALQHGSLAIDAGDNNADLDGAGSGTTTISDIAIDLAGQPRIVDGDGNLTATVDLGAYENQPILCPAGGVLYVDEDATGWETGESWADAFTTLQDSLYVIESCEIWVAEGVYYPDEGVGQTDNDRTASFQLKNGVGVYGGFIGTETARDQRSPAINFTILSGDLNGNDNGNVTMNEPTSADNSYHVVSGVTGATLDGFTITAGNANDGSSGPWAVGGGMYNNGSGPVLTNIIFTSNSAFSSGGMENTGGSNPIMTNITFVGNSASFAGGGMSNVSSSPTLTNVTFNGNSAFLGGGMANFSGDPILTNVTFSGNFGFNHGGGMLNDGSNPTLTNVTFSSNASDYYGTGIGEGGGMYNEASSNPEIRNTIFWGNTAGAGGAQIFNEAGSPKISDSVVQDGCPVGSICTNIITTDPKLGALGNFGGFTQTIPLLANSSAINRGNDATCAAADQRGVTRPQGVHCDIGAYEIEIFTMTTRSVGTYDGWILESTETSNLGGTLDSASTTINLGDGAQDKQYRAILSFNTGPLPDNAVITKVILKIRRQGVLDTNPFNILGGLKVDMRKPFFGTTLGLVISDFQAVAGKNTVAQFQITPANNWYSANLNAIGRAYINLIGTTQFRLRFFKDDNDDGNADYMKFYSGNYAYAISRPTLVIEYYIP